MKRTAVGSRELKTRLGTYLQWARKGRVVVVTDRGRPVAELTPVSVEGTGDGRRLDELVTLGVLTRRSSAPLSRLRPVSLAGKALSGAILDERGNRD